MKDFRKKVGECEARVIIEDWRKPPQTAIEKAKAVLCLTGKTRYDIWHPDEVPFIGPMKPKRKSDDGYYEVCTYR